MITHAIKHRFTYIHKHSLADTMVSVESDEHVYCLSKAEASREKENIGVGTCACRRD